MRDSRHRRILAALFAAIAILFAGSRHAAAAGTPRVGEKAPEFTLQSPDGDRVQLSQVTSRSKVVLVMLRGYPGYQCPFCTAQVGNLLSNADQFNTAQAQVVLVYPGEAAQLDQHAREFLRDKKLPANFTFLLDPDYRFTLSYGLRWTGRGETAYPATFVLDQQRIVRFARVSKEHGGRVPAEEALKALRALP